MIHELVLEKTGCKTRVFTNLPPRNPLNRNGHSRLSALPSTFFHRPCGRARGGGCRRRPAKGPAAGEQRCIRPRAGTLDRAARHRSASGCGGEARCARIDSGETYSGRGQKEHEHPPRVGRDATGQPSLITPPGSPDLITLQRFLAPGRTALQGVAWSGAGRITRVEVSTDDTATWREATLVPVSEDRFAWTQWRIDWDATPGDHILACRATDEAGDVQPVNPENRWNRQGMGVNGVQRVHVTVMANIGAAGTRVPSPAHVVVRGAEAVPVPQTVNGLAGAGRGISSAGCMRRRWRRVQLANGPRPHGGKLGLRVRLLRAWNRLGESP